MNFIAKYIHFIGFIVLGPFAVAAAWPYFDVTAHSQNHPSNGRFKAAYTCPMHPGIVEDHAGKCPKCGMRLVVVRTASSSNADCEHQVGLDECCAKPTATRLPLGHPPINLQLPPGHPPIDGSRTNMISWEPGA
jgi:hypothetical protein